MSCVYTAQADGRGTAPKSYVRLLQTRINLLEKILWLHSIDIDEATTRLAQLDALPNDSDRSTLAAAGQSNVAFAELCDKFEGVLSIDESLNFDGDGEARYFGPASGRLEFDCPDSQTDSPSNSDRSAQPHSIETGIDCDLEAHLLELYFTWEGPWLHIVDEALFRESRETNGRFFSPLLLNCILACACRYSDRPEVRSNPDDPNTAGDRFREAAEALLPREVKVPNITTIQSLAVLSMSYHVSTCQSACITGYKHLCAYL